MQARPSHNTRQESSHLDLSAWFLQDPEAGTVTTSTGEVYTGDVIIGKSSHDHTIRPPCPAINIPVCPYLSLNTGSDGIKSAVRSSIVGDALNSVPSGHSAYRMLIPADKIREDPELNALGITEPNLTAIYGNGRRIICYPCRNGTILNFVCILREYRHGCPKLAV